MPKTQTGVMECGWCGEFLYQLRSPDGEVLRVEPAESPGPGWRPEPDGESVTWVEDGGHEVHDCLAGQEMLL